VGCLQGRQAFGKVVIWADRLFGHADSLLAKTPLVSPHDNGIQEAIPDRFTKKTIRPSLETLF